MNTLYAWQSQSQSSEKLKFHRGGQEIVGLTHRVAVVLYFTKAPHEGQSPGTGFGSSDDFKLNFSEHRDSRYRAIQTWSPISAPLQGPTLKLHCPGITSLLVPARKKV